MYYQKRQIIRLFLKIFFIQFIFLLLNTSIYSQDSLIIRKNSMLSNSIPFDKLLNIKKIKQKEYGYINKCSK